MYLGTEIKSHGEYTGKNAWKVEFSKKELSSAAGTILRCPVPLPENRNIVHEVQNGGPTFFS